MFEKISNGFLMVFLRGLFDEKQVFKTIRLPNVFIFYKPVYLMLIYLDKKTSVSYRNKNNTPIRLLATG